MHAECLEYLKNHLKPGAVVLDVVTSIISMTSKGCGSGYMSSCMSRMMDGKGKVIGIDYIGSSIYKQ